MADGSLNVQSVPPGVPFVDVLARGVLADYGAADDPLGLSRVTILLPTRRAVRALREAFLRAGGGRPLLLPRMRPVGDVEEEELLLGAGAATGLAGEGALSLPPTVAPLRRQLLLARLIARWGDVRGNPYSPGNAARLAAELARLIDQVETEGLSFADLDRLAPDRFAAHWQETLEFLKIATAAWPEILAQEGCIDPAAHRNRMLGALAAAWEAAAPRGPVIAAGSTGSVPATARLLRVVAGLAQGLVLLPGLDRHLDAESWQALDPAHPQYGMAQLLAKFGLARDQVPDWGHADRFAMRTNRARIGLLAEALRPADTTDMWRDAGAALQAALPAALKGLSFLECPAEREEAAAIALALREVLQTPGKTAALVTPDRGLARRVAAELKRWDLEIDDSAGVPLADTPPLTLLRALIEAHAQAFAPVAWLALVKHPLVHAGWQRGRFRAAAREFERRCLRGPRPAPGLGVLAMLATESGDDALVALTARFADLLTPLAGIAPQDAISLADYLGALVQVAEALCATDEAAGETCLWAGEAGEAASLFIAELGEQADLATSLRLRDCPAFIDALLEGRAVRPRYGRHPRLFIWGPLEARLQHADLMILGGLNEDSWPAQANTDPWLSRPMRAAFGLPAPEQRIGLSAHDFAQAASAPEVILSRARKTGGAPAIASRWWLRIENLLSGIGDGDWRAQITPARWLDWADRLDKPAQIIPADPPLPRPPVHLRPRGLSVSDVEVLVRDPYAIYAKHVLGLSPLDPLDAELGGAERGTVIHDILERFLRARGQALAPGDLRALRALGAQAFDTALTEPGIRAFWKPRFDELAGWFIEWDLTHRLTGALPAGVEVEGKLTFDAPGGPFTLRARADRVDRYPDGSLAIFDYKTGSNPTQKQIKAGFAPQLPLEGAIATYGEFKGIGKGGVAQIAILRLRGIDPPGEFIPIAIEQIEIAYNGLRDKIAKFDAPDVPYPSRLAPMLFAHGGSYDHLARVREWSSDREGEA